MAISLDYPLLLRTKTWQGMKVVACDGGVALGRWADPPACIVVPAKVNGQNVRTLKGWCFRDCKAVRTLHFEDGSCVTKIEDWAFSGCTSLCSFVWPRGVDTIPWECFKGCSNLSDFRFEDASCLKKIDTGAFSDCRSLSSFVWPRSVDTIPERCFEVCEALRDFRFEDASCLRKIQESPFFLCKSLCEFVWPCSIESIPGGCFYGCQSLRDLRFEDVSRLKRIENEAFGDCFSLCSFVWPRSIHLIRAYCFQNCKSLRDFRFEDSSSLNKIENGAFEGCQSLTKFVWPRNVSTIPHGCFQNCYSLCEFRCEDMSCLKKIEVLAFGQCSSLSSFVWPRQVDTIPASCFWFCKSLRDFRFEDGACVSTIGANAFTYCGLITFSVPCSVEFIGDGCFSDCDSLRTVVLEQGTKLSKDDLEGAGLGSGVEVVLSEEGRRKPLSEFLIDLSSLEKQTPPHELVSGGTGCVKLFKRKTDGKLIVGKFLESDNSGMSQKIFEREISNLIALDHPCIVSLSGYVLPCSLTKHRFVVFTEYVSGGSLSDAISLSCSSDSLSHWFDSTTRASIVVGIVHAMKYIHSRGIIHRDLKPSNVLLDEQHRPLICDFGSSRVLASDMTLTQSPQLTMYYAAPEFGDEDTDYDSKVDVYSFGMMLYEVVTGRLALRHLNQYQVMPFIVRGKRPDIPDKVLPFTRSLITRCWSGDPSQRPSFSDIYSELVTQNFRIFEDVDSRVVASYVQSLPR